MGPELRVVLFMKFLIAFGGIPVVTILYYIENTMIFTYGRERIL